MRWPLSSSAVRIVTIYLAAGVAWILATDLLVARLVGPGQQQLVQTLKGWIFVVGSALLLYGLIRYEKRRARRLSDRLESTRDLLEEAGRILSDAVIVVDAERRAIVACNPAAEEMFGYDREELIGSSTRLLHVDEEHHREFARRGDPELAAEGSWRGEFRMRRADGRVIHTQHAVSLLEGRDGEPARAVSVIRDVTDRRELERELRRREERQEAILASISDVVTVLDRDGTIRYESPSIRHVLGWEPGELVGRPAFELIHPEDRDQVERLYRDTLGSGRRRGTVEYRFRHAEGGWRTLESRGMVAEAADIDGTVVVSRDITERRESEAKFSAVFDVSPSAIALTTLEEGRFLAVNETFVDLTGYDREEVLGRTSREIDFWHPPDDRDRVVAELRGGGVVRSLETRLRLADGELADVLYSGALLEVGDDQLLVSVAQDIRERKQFERELERQALYDTLTGLPNRSLLHDRLVHALERTGGDDEAVGLLFVDLDRFKAVNDSLGHPAGDEVLRQVADRLSRTLRDRDTVARFGGDEFFVLLEGADDLPGDLERAAERVRTAFEAPFEAAGASFRLTASIGAVHSGVPFEGADDLIRMADAAMYRVKQPESTGFHLFDPDQDAELTQRLHLETALRRALDEDQFVVHYHPIYRLPDLEIVGVESLARWEHPERGLLPPAEFIPAAEDSGLIVPLGHRVLEKALRQAVAWREAGQIPSTGFRISVNLSARQYQQEGLVEDIVAAAEEVGFPLEMLTLEITETILLTGRGKLQRLRDRGVRVAIDDFGTGYSSLHYLRRLEADSLKLDRSFVADLTGSKRSSAIVEAVLTVADRLGLDVVAEGVETEAQLRWLADARCGHAQGYHFTRPVTAEGFAALMADGRPDGRPSGRD